MLRSHSCLYIALVSNVDEFLVLGIMGKCCFLVLKLYSLCVAKLYLTDCRISLCSVKLINMQVALAGTAKNVTQLWSSSTTVLSISVVPADSSCSNTF